MSAPKDGRPGRPDHVTATVKAEAGTFDEVRRRVKAPHRPVLVVLSGPDVGVRALVDRTLLVGRDPAAELPLRDAQVSWQHARIEDRGDGWALLDLGSTNGTAVNGRRAPECELQPGDTIALGNTVMRFELQDEIAQQYNEFVERLLNVDDLSGLLVRRKFDAELALLLQAARAAGQPLGLLVMDLDGIKPINDTHGHLFGAYVIGASGHVIGEVLAGRGIGSRFGGDEFLAALPGLDVEATAVVGEEIRRAIAGHAFEHEGVRLRPGISIGVAAFPQHADEPRALFQHGDEALYRAKQGGKNRVRR
ncbi:MAG TPA: GGDEF domain-containing protein [Polyangia bacterium]